MDNIILAVTGATEAAAAKIFIEKSPAPISLVYSKWGKEVYERECGPISDLEKKAAKVFDNNDLAASISSGSVKSAGMVILPSSANTLAEIASGICSTLITRTAHCQLKERRKLILCLRESPLSFIDLRNAKIVTQAGGIIMPMSPQFYMFGKKDTKDISLYNLLDSFTDRVFSLLGFQTGKTWEDVVDL
ncbi:UbiX family flavin prenyltransferase [Candidatus Saganbacteria bacterium]|nr:UbiX family flavin prenyltransferase [Candidatus Saganbacteria bacterium]